ncbi:MAG TPA: Ig-like domain-containing protein [Solirubrobacterales bacterium]|nr:Ig-like domain-containing protein [Solirubrobacterales bacterium]
MNSRPSSPRIAVLTLALGCLLAALAATAVAKPQPTASSKRVSTVCAKKANRAASAAKRREIRQRCVRETNRASTSRRRTTDVTPPSVAWKTPTAGVTVKEMVSGSSCEAGASDDRGVVRVVMKVDGVTLNTESDAPWNCVFDSRKVSDGAHTLTATAYDAAGNSRTASVTVNVDNVPAPTPTPEPEPEPEPTPTPTPGDTTAPSVAWLVPTAGATVSGAISGASCEAKASDDVAVDRVVMKVDGAVLNTESDGPWNCKFDSTLVGNGSHTLTATAYDAAGNSSTASVTVNVSNVAPAPAPEPAPEPAPIPGPSPTVGSLAIGVDGGHGYWSPTEISYRAQLGAVLTRHEWDPAEPVRHQEEIVLAAAGQIGTRIHALLGGNNLGNATSYREYVVAFIGRYGLGGSFWKEHPELDEARYAITSVELGNEPYFGEMSATLYADTVRPTLEAIKNLGLPVKVILASRVYGTDTAWIDTLYARIPSLNNLFYGFADHPYWYGRDPGTISAAGPFGRVDVLRRRMNEKGASAKPIWITEYGQSTASCGVECVSETAQAEHLKKFLTTAVTRTEWKIETFFPFQLRDRSTSPSDREHGFGLLRYNGTAKPSYSVVRGLMQQYRG